MHPVTAYFLIIDERSQCAVCILCSNQMKATKTANLMRHMSRYHKLVAAELEKQWDEMKGRAKRKDTHELPIVALSSLPLTVPVQVKCFASSVSNGESGAHENYFAENLSHSSDCDLGGSNAAEDTVCELADGFKDDSSGTDDSSVVPVATVDSSQRAATIENCEEKKPLAKRKTTTTASTATMTFFNTDGNGVTPTEILKKQELLQKQTELLLERQLERERLFDERQERFWARVEALLKLQEERQRELLEISSQLKRAVQNSFEADVAVTECVSASGSDFPAAISGC